MSKVLDQVRNLPAAQRAELRQRLWERGQSTTALDAQQADGDAPASFTQRRMMFLQQANPDTAAYHSTVLFELSGRLELAALRGALDDLLVRHAVLRTALVVRDGHVVQQVRPAAPVALRVHDLSGLRAVERDSERDRLAAADQACSFDLVEGAPARFSLLWTGEAAAELLVTFHHAVIDGWSLAVFTRDLGALYRARRDDTPDALPSLPVTYTEYARWQQDWLAGEEAHRQVTYWEQRLDGTGSLPLPTDRPRPATPSFAGDQVDFTVPLATRDGLDALAAGSGATLFMVLLAAFQVVLARYSGEDDVTVGTPVANRRYGGFHDLVGFFANSVVLRTGVHLGQSFRDLLAEVRDNCLDAYEHQDVPLDVLVRRLQPDRDLGRNPLYQVNLTLHNTPDPVSDGPDLVITPRHVPDIGARFDLDLNVRAGEDGLHCTLTYATDLFDRVTVNRLTTAFRLVLDAIKGDPGTAVGELPLMTSAELADVRAASRGVDVPRSANPLLHELVRLQCESTPDSVAVSSVDARLTCAELDRLANGLAHRLVAAGAGRGDVVAVLLPRCPGLLVAPLGVLKAGAAYLPLDPTHPPRRLVHTLCDSDARLLVTDDATRELLPDGTDLPPCVSMTVGEKSDRPPQVRAHADDPVYVMYTSGSTGSPKGVVVTHRAVTNYLLWAGPAFGIRAGDAVPVHTSPAVDLTVTSLFAPLLAGARVCLLAGDGTPGADLLASAQEDTGLGFVKLTPSHLRLLAGSDVADRAARWTRLLVVGGEDLHAEHIAAWQRTPGAPRVINEYGPTEAAVACAAFVVGERLPADRVPIGTPLPNIQLYVLDELMRPLPFGAPGELYVGGVGVAQGYRRGAAETAARFVPDPFGSEPGARLYRTGDRVRRLADGTLEYLGRLDGQRKVRGHRVEPGEIERLVAEHPAVSQCVVDTDTDGELVVFAGVDPPADTGLQDAQVAQWSGLYEDTYGRGPADPTDPTFDLTGWNSSTNGLPIDSAQMRDWLSDTVDRIRELRPRRVLELGCGTGMILFRVAGDCEHYVGCDVSTAVIDRLRGEAGGNDLDLRVAPAHRSVQAGDVFDTVVLNSVIQYFPSIAYLLDVLAQVIAVMPTGGHVFVGDVRNLLLLETFHTAIEARAAHDSVPAGEIRARVRGSVDREEELCVDPLFFHDLPALLDRVSAVRVLPKRGWYRNELSCYRYDAVITVSEPAERPGPADDWRDWAGLPALTDLLAQHRPDAVALRAVPNARLTADVELRRRVSTAPATTPIGELRDQPDESVGIEPEQLWQLATRYPYEVELSWAHGRRDGAFDLLLRRRDRGVPQWIGPAGPVSRALSSYANNPLWHIAAAPITAELNQLLRERLPAPVVPGRYLLLPAIPLTPGGKVDRRALRELAATHRSDATDEVDTRPLTDTERRIAEIWGQLLSREGIRPQDDFFDLGGHSLLTFQLVFRLRTEFEVEVPIRMPFESSTLAEQATVVDGLVGERQTDAGRPELVAVPREPHMSASFAQERLWFLQQLEPESIQYNFPIFVRMRGPLRTAVLTAALGDVLRRHEVLRTTLVPVAGRPVQSIGADIPLAVPVTDLSSLPAADREAAAAAEARRQFQSPFDLAAPPVVRTDLLRLAPDDHVLLLTMHHVAVDGWSRSILLDELAECYTARHEGRPALLPELPVQYADFAVWQRRLRDEGHYDALREHWVQRLDGIQELPGLPTDHPRPARPTHRRSAVNFRIPTDVVTRLRTLCRQEDCTLFMVLLAAVYALLHRRTGRQDLVVGSDVAGRPDTATERLIGFFVNLVVLRVSMAGQPTGRELVRRTRAAALDAYTHQDLPFEEVVKVLNPKRGLNQSPLFGVQVAFNNAPKSTPVLPGLTVEPFDVSIIETTRVDTAVLLTEDDGGVRGTWECDAELFDEDTVREFGRQYVDLVAALAARPDQDVAGIESRADRDGPVARTGPGRRRGGLTKLRPTPVALAPATLVSREPLGERNLPLLLRATHADVDLVRWAVDERDSLETALRDRGALLFRGFAGVDATVFESFAALFVTELFDENGEHPRTAVSANVYTPTFFPPEQKLLWHNENSFNRQGPAKIWFCCVRPAETGGQTPLADSREVYRRLDPRLRAEFIAKGVRYVRNYGTGLGLDWRTVFRTESRAEVEERCAREGLLFEWHGDRLRTTAERPAVLRHPVTGAWSWFNQAQHWHIACLGPRTRDSLLATFAPDELPRSCFFGDGSPIPDDAMAEICRVYQECEVVFDWQRGDVLMVDNILTAHARNPFQGERELLVTMGDMVSFE
jgi:amino acid adenylation domain-containing protein